MKNNRIKMTENEKMAAKILGDNPTSQLINMGDVDSIFEREKTSKFNNEVEHYKEQLEESNKTLIKTQEEVPYDINKAEIKPMFSRVIIKPFEVNPFQQMKVKNGIIVNAGGYDPHIEINPTTGKYEEQKQFIVTGCVVEVGPDVRYVKEEDVVYYRVDTAIPLPFFNQGFVSIDEKQLIAVVAENLTKRFNNDDRG